MSILEKNIRSDIIKSDVMLKNAINQYVDKPFISIKQKSSVNVKKTSLSILKKRITYRIISAKNIMAEQFVSIILFIFNFIL